MCKPMKNNKLIIICLFLISTSIADDKLNNLINDEYENISDRTSIDYYTKVVQVWHDSTWINKAKAMKNYDEIGFEPGAIEQNQMIN